MISRKIRDLYYQWSGESVGRTYGPWLVFASNGRMYMVPNDETDETLVDRIRRSEEAGRNLFYEELEEFIPAPDELW